jgi:hypothetical protein
VALLLTGLGNVAFGLRPLPFDLSSYGLTNCDLRVRPDASVFLAGTGHAATFALAIPPIASLAGLSMHQQALVLDAAAPDPAGLVMSDAATAVVGR